MRRRNYRALIAAFPVLFATPALAALTTFTWNGGSGNFSSANWTKGEDLADASTHPDDSDDGVIFNAAGAQTITLTGTTTSGGGLNLAGTARGGGLIVTGAAAVTVNMAGNTWNALPIAPDGPTPTTATFIGTTAGDNASFTIQSSAAGAVLRSHLAAPADRGPVAIGNSASTGVGTILLTNAAGHGVAWEVEGDFTVLGIGSSLTVNGTGSKLNVVRGGLTLRNGASVSITDGGVIASNSTSLGTFGGANTLTVDGAGSTYRHTNTNSMTLGENGTLQLNISNGGVIEQSALVNAEMGRSSLSGANAINLTGDGSRFTVGGIYIAGNSTTPQGSTNATHKSVINVGAGTRVQAINSVATGTAAQIGAGIKVWDRGIVNLTGGTVEVAAGKNLELVDHDTVNARQAGRGTLRGSGTIQRYGNAGTPFMTLLNTSGEIRPGDAGGTVGAGLLTFNNANFNHADAGFLFIDLATPTAYDQMRFIDTDNLAGTTTATLDGTLEYALDAGFTLPANGFLDFVLAEDVNYSPAADNLTALLDAAGFAGQYTYGVETVGATDYAGQFVGYEVLRLSTVPEPASALLLGVGSLLLARRRR